MRELQTLNLSHNSLIELPAWFDQLQCLREVNLNDNRKLTHLHPHVATLHKFTCTGCNSITEPPSAVCQGGLQDIKQYYNDLKKGRTHIVLSTIVLIGRKEAGKSTLLCAMQSGFNAEAKPKDVKKAAVFEFQTVNLENGDEKHEVQIVDFGGDDVYHYAYQLTFRENCIPVEVVKIEEYKEISEKWGRREAARRVAFDWLSHILIVSPDIEKPLLVLTHVDKLENKEVEGLREELLSTLEDLGQEFLEDRDIPKIRILEHTDSQCSEMFHPDYIFKIGYGTSGHSKNLDDLQVTLCSIVKAKKQTVPEIWDKEMKSIKENKQGCIQYSDLPKSHGAQVFDVLLGYMKRSGLILHYTGGRVNDVSLSDVIFHNIAAVAKLISTLYHHSMNERISIKPKVLLRKNTYQTERRVDSFACNGIISVDNMEDIIPDSDNCIPYDIAMKLIRKFRLLYGPQSVNGVESYLVPFFLQRHSFPDNSAEIRIHGTMNFRGLAVPNYAFHQLTVTFLEMFSPDAYQIFPYWNGASAKLLIKTAEHTGNPEEEAETGDDTKNSDFIDIHIIHDIDNQKVGVRVEGCASQIAMMWNIFKQLLNRLERGATSAWKAARTDFTVSCPHCLLINRDCTSYVESKAMGKHSRPGFGR